MGFAHTLPCHRVVYMLPSNNPLCPRQQQQKPCQHPYDNARAIFQTMQSLLFFLCKIVKSFRRNLNVQKSFFQEAKICLYDDVLVPWIKGRLGLNVSFTKNGSSF